MRSTIGVFLMMLAVGAGSSFTAMARADGPAESAVPAAGLESFGYEVPLEELSAQDSTEAASQLIRHLEIPPGIEQQPEELSKAQNESRDNLEAIEKRMRLLGGQIHDLRSEILSLGENISTGFVSATKLLVIHQNRLGKAFEIESIEYKIDGFTVYSNADLNRIQANPDLVVFDASVLPGNHTLDVIYTLRATGHGIFTYMEEYKFDLRNQYHFATPTGKAVELNVEALDQGSSKVLRDRPVLKFSVR